MMQDKQYSAYQGKVLTIPNLLSFFRLCLIPMFMWSYCVKEDSLLTVLILGVSGITDVADGYIARTFHMVSDLGKVLDPIADKLTQAAMLVSLVTRFPLMLLALAIMVAKEIYMGVSGFLIIRRTGTVLGADWHGKVATVLLYSMILLHVLWADIPALFSDFTIVLAACMVLVSFVFYGIRNTRHLRREKQV